MTRIGLLEGNCASLQLIADSFTACGFATEVLKENDFIIAARLIGQRNALILLKHLLPNCFPSLIVLFTLNLGSAIILEGSLSFLGVESNPLQQPGEEWWPMVTLI